MRFIFIDSRVFDISSIVLAFTSDVQYYIFDWNVDTYEDLKNKLIKDYESIGIIQHNYYSNEFQFLSDASSATLKNIEENDPECTTWADYVGFLQWIHTNCNCYFIDLFACDLWNNADWRYVIQTIQEKYGVHIRASVNEQRGTTDYLFSGLDV